VTCVTGEEFAQVRSGQTNRSDGLLLHFWGVLNELIKMPLSISPLSLIILRTPNGVSGLTTCGLYVKTNSHLINVSNLIR
jgi:hypothetical protein